MTNILTRCDTIYKNTSCCHNDPNRVCDCSVCLREGFYGGKDTYSCLKKLCYYTMNYGPAYVSEIYHFLKFSKILEQNFNGRTIDILSLGCGFGPDFTSVTNYIEKMGLNINVQYHGLDKERLWAYINNWAPPNIFCIQDVLQGFRIAGYDIIFINKLFSTLKNANLENVFLNILESEINNLDVGSFVIFNDINSVYKGRDDFDRRIGKLLNTQAKYFFNVRSAGKDAYNGNYIEIPYTQNICQIPQNTAVKPKLSVMQTVIFVYKR